MQSINDELKTRNSVTVIIKGEHYRFILLCLSVLLLSQATLIQDLADNGTFLGNILSELSTSGGTFSQTTITPMADTAQNLDDDSLAELTAEELAEQAAQQKELQALAAQLASSADEPADTAAESDSDDDDLLGDTDALVEAAKASAAKARAAAEQAEGVDVSKSAARAEQTLASARMAAATASSDVATSNQDQQSQPSSAAAPPSKGAEAGESDDEDEAGQADAPQRSVLSNSNWDERLRAQRESEVMEIVGPVVASDAEKLSLFKQASKMMRTGSVTPQQYMRALGKLLGGPIARRVIPLLADAIPDAARRAELHDAFRAAEREAAAAKAAAKGHVPGAQQAPAAARTASSVPATTSETASVAPSQPLFSVPSSSAAAPTSAALAFDSPAPGDTPSQGPSGASADASKPPPSAARQALFAEEEPPATASVAPAKYAEDEEEATAATALPTVAVQGGSTFDPLAAPPQPASTSVTAAFDPLAAPPAAAHVSPPAAPTQPDPLAAPAAAAPAPAATAAGGGSSGQATSDAFASAQGEGRASANGVGTVGSPGSGSKSPPPGGMFSGLYAAPAHLREGITVQDGEGGDAEEEGGSVVASCPHDGGQLTVAMWDTMSQSDDSGRTFTLYALRCTWVRENRKVQWLVGRRYSEFELLRSSLSNTLQHHPQFAGRIMPPLPGKTLFGSNSEAVVSERRTKLAVFLLQLFQTYPIALRTTEMDSFLKITPRIGAVVNDFIDRDARNAAAGQPQVAGAGSGPATAATAHPPPCAEYFLSLPAPAVLTLEHLNRHAVRLCSVFKAMTQRPPVLNGLPPSRDAVLQATAKAASVALRCLEASAAAATDESQVGTLQLGEGTVDAYLTQVLESQDRLQASLSELASLETMAASAGSS